MWSAVKVLTNEGNETTSIKLGIGRLPVNEIDEGSPVNWRPHSIGSKGTFLCWNSWWWPQFGFRSADKKIRWSRIFIIWFLFNCYFTSTCSFNPFKIRQTWTLLPPANQTKLLWVPKIVRTTPFGKSKQIIIRGFLPLFRADCGGSLPGQITCVGSFVRTLLYCIELQCISLNFIKLHWVELHRSEMQWIVLSCIEFSCSELYWIAWNCIQLPWIAFNCI